jgi:hypothetical protein
MLRRVVVTVTVTGYPGSASQTSTWCGLITSHQSRAAAGTSENLNWTTVSPSGTASWSTLRCMDRDLADLGRRHDHGSPTTDLDWEYRLLIARKRG